MKTSHAVLASIFIALFILTSGLVIYIIIQGVSTRDSYSEQPLMNAAFKAEDVTDENGEIYGQRGYVEITQKELETISALELKAFADKYVKNSQFKWISITTSGGAGIYFPDADYEYAEYGHLSPDGRTASLQATITLEEGAYVFHNPGTPGYAPREETP